MKLIFNTMIICTTMTLLSCGVKKNLEDSNLSTKYTLAVFNDINNASTFDESTLGDIPKSVDLKEFMTPVKDQDDRGTCSHFTAAALVESAIKKKMNIEVNLSEEYINYSSKQNGYFSQTEAGNALTNLYTSIIDKKDFLLERDWPYQPIWFGSNDKCYDFVADDQNAPAECYSHNAPPEEVMKKKILGSDFELHLMKNATTNEMIIDLATNKRPMSIAIPVNQRGWKNNGEVEYSDEMRKECIKTPQVCGSHEVVITGYDLDKKVFFFKNSWGRYWGIEGYGTFPIEMIDRHTRHSSVSVELKNDIVMPADHNVNPAVLDSFDITSKFSFVDNSFKIIGTGVVKNIGFNTIKMGSTLMMKAIGMKDDISVFNEELVTMNLEDYANLKVDSISSGYVFFPKSDLGDLVLTGDPSATIDSSLKLLSTNSVMDLINDDRELYFRTSLYMYSDDGGYKVLKRYKLPYNNGESYYLNSNHILNTIL